MTRVEHIGEQPGYIMSAQPSLFGQPDVIGFGTRAFRVVEIDRDRANAIIAANHYSRKFYNNSLIHLGVHIGDAMVGVLQFGQAMNPASGPSVVAGTTIDQFLELNRMWLSDAAPRNSESRALSYALKFIRRKAPAVRWIQSFADERCGLFGTVYQAAGFGFYGEHNATFWELDGVVYHNSMMTRDPSQARSAGILQAGKERARELTLRQFRYLYFMKPRFAKGCRLKQLPYPKPDYAARPVDAPVPTGASEAQPLGAAPDQAEAA